MKRILEFIEKRFHPRQPSRIPATFMIFKGTSAKVTEYHVGTIIDVSRKGCCLIIDKLTFDGFYLMKCIEDTETYTVKMKLDDETETLGKICWISSYSDGQMQGFKIGMGVVGDNKIYDRIQKG